MPISAASPKRVLILICAESEFGQELNTSFVKGLNNNLEPDIQLEWRHYNDIGMSFSKGKIEAFMVDGESLANFNFVYFKSLFRYYEQATAIAEYLDEVHVPFVSSELQYYLPVTKLTQYARLARAGLPIADTVFIHGNKLSSSYGNIIKIVGTPFVFKAIDGSQGNRNFLVTSRIQFQSIIAHNPEERMIAQAYIPNSCDLRVLIVNKKIKLIIERRRKNNSSHLNNTTRGAKASLVPLKELSPESRGLALKAAKIMRREVAGVDIIFDSNSYQPYILEVNASPHVAGGAFVEEKLKIYSEYFRNVLKL